jgi:D-glycero-D-manno-heptose 1,7-bisphosphate phosphatase
MGARRADDERPLNRTVSGTPAGDAPAAAVFLDRDGVLNELVVEDRSGLYESPYRPEDVTLMPGVPEALRALREAGFRLVVVSNQPAAAKGIATIEALGAVHERIEALLAEQGVGIEAFRYCLHHPEGVEPELTRSCHCRKPAPGLILDAARELGLDPRTSWLVGDADRDIAAGRAAGCRTILVENPRSRHRRGGGPAADLVAPNLREAVTLLLQERR